MFLIQSKDQAEYHASSTYVLVQLTVAMEKIYLFLAVLKVIASMLTEQAFASWNNSEETPQYQLNCTFEEDDCGWKNTGYQWWARSNTTDDDFMFAEMTYLKIDNTAILESPWLCAKPGSQYYVNFTYQMPNNNFSTLSVFSNACDQKAEIWTSCTNDTFEWEFVSQDVSFNCANCSFQIIFEAYKFNQWCSDSGCPLDIISIDNIYIDKVDLAFVSSTLAPTTAPSSSPKEEEINSRTLPPTTTQTHYQTPSPSTTLETTSIFNIGTSANAEQTALDTNNLSSGAVAGIVIAVILVIVIIVAAVIIMFRRRDDKETNVVTRMLEPLKRTFRN